MQRKEISADLEKFYVLLLQEKYDKVIESLERDQRNEAKELVLRASLGLSKFDKTFEKMEKDLDLKLFAARITMNSYTLKAREILEEISNFDDLEIRKLYVTTLINLKDYDFCYDWLDAFPNGDDRILREMVTSAKAGNLPVAEISDSDSDISNLAFDRGNERVMNRDNSTIAGNLEQSKSKGHYSKTEGPDYALGGKDGHLRTNNDKPQPPVNWNLKFLDLLNSNESKIIISYARKYLPSAVFVLSLLFYAGNRGRTTRAGKLIAWFEEKLYKTIQMGSSI